MSAGMTPAVMMSGQPMRSSPALAFPRCSIRRSPAQFVEHRGAAVE